MKERWRMEQRVVRGRFAPSPSGRMHLGNLFTALLGWLSANGAGGSLVLRMEDLDPDRCRTEYAQQLAEDLRWLGLLWQEGYDIGGAAAPYLQSQRTERYEQAFHSLAEKGLVYPCYCTRAQRLAASAPHRADGQGVYDGRCTTLTQQQQRDLAEMGRRPAWRLRVSDETISFVDGHMGAYCEHLRRDCGDFIIRRSDGVYAYQLAVVVDDIAMAVNQVVRGCDLLSSTPRQIYLHQLLGNQPPQFYHVPLLLAEDGRRLSKREHDMDMGVLRKRFTPEELLGRLAYLAGQLDYPTPLTAQALVPRFQWDKVPREDICVPRELFQV